MDPSNMTDLLFTDFLVLLLVLRYISKYITIYHFLPTLGY